MTHAATAIINLPALRHNLIQARRFAPHSKILAVIKADAYGHGLMRVAHALQDADAFAVAHIEEAIRLRHHDIAKPIVLLQGFANAHELHDMARLNIESVIHSPFQVAMLEKKPPTPATRLWLKVDTGMHRLGVAPDDVADVYARLTTLQRGQKPLVLMSHFSSSDESAEITAQQLQLFTQLVPDTQIEKTIANSAAIIHYPESHFDWVRPGIMLYGISPFADQSAESFGLKPVMTFKSRLIDVKAIRKGASVGYGATWRAEQDTVVGIVGAGYGDGYPRHAQNGTPVLINGNRFPIVGRVSMDMICVNLGNHAHAKHGDDVILWGEGLPVDEIAKHASTIPYELVCKITNRVKFVEQAHG